MNNKSYSWLAGTRFYSIDQGRSRMQSFVTWISSQPLLEITKTMLNYILGQVLCQLYILISASMDVQTNVLAHVPRAVYASPPWVLRTTLLYHVQLSGDNIL